jgi:hypothetical protein
VETLNKIGDIFGLEVGFVKKPNRKPEACLGERFM